MTGAPADPSCSIVIVFARCITLLYYELLLLFLLMHELVSFYKKTTKTLFQPCKTRFPFLYKFLFFYKCKKFGTMLSRDRVARYSSEKKKELESTCSLIFCLEIISLFFYFSFSLPNSKVLEADYYLIEQA